MICFCLQVQLQAQTLEEDKARLVSSVLVPSALITSALCKLHHLCPDSWRYHLIRNLFCTDTLKMPLVNNKWSHHEWMTLALSFLMFMWGKHYVGEGACVCGIGLSLSAVIWFSNHNGSTEWEGWFLPSFKHVLCHYWYFNLHKHDCWECWIYTNGTFKTLLCSLISSWI